MVKLEAFRKRVRVREKIDSGQFYIILLFFRLRHSMSQPECGHLSGELPFYIPIATAQYLCHLFAMGNYSGSRTAEK